MASMVEEPIQQGPPVVHWTMPVPLGPLVRYYPSSVGDPPSYGFVVVLGERTVDLMVATANYRGLLPKNGVRHAQDPDNWRHREYMGGIWLDIPINLQVEQQFTDLETRLAALDRRLKAIEETV